jgi:hypothetical protein
MFGSCPPPLSVVEILDAPGQAAGWLAVERPGPDTVGAVSMLDPASLDQAGRVDALVALERAAAWVAGLQQRVLATLDDDDEDGWMREGVACALSLSGVSAQHRLAVAQELTGRLPNTLRLLESGVISYLQAMTLAEASYGLDDDTVAAVERRVLARAGEQTVGEFRRSVRRAVAALAAARVEEERQQAMAERHVCVTARDDGMAELWALLPAEGAAAVMAAVDALAHVTSADDPRSADQRRADALVGLGVSALHDPHLPKAHGMRPAIQVTVAASTLLGLDQQPGELAGHGPIPASAARRIAADPTGTWRRLLTDPGSGQLLDYGRTTYRPPRDLADFVIARDQTCTFPGCVRRGQRCDIDHETPFDAGGSTSPQNLAALCRRHHRAKHETGWRVRRSPHTGTSHWTAPTGHSYKSRPPDLSGTDPPPF